MGRSIVIKDENGTIIDVAESIADFATTYGLSYTVAKRLVSTGRVYQKRHLNLRAEYGDVKGSSNPAVLDKDKFAHLIPLYPDSISHKWLSIKAGLTHMRTKSMIDSIGDTYLVCEDDNGRYSRLREVTA